MADDNVVKGRFSSKKETCWECECGGQLWFITPDGYRCYKCAMLHTYDELADSEDE